MKTKNFRRNLYLACSDDDLRPSMCHVAFIDGKAVCTDAHILVEQDLSEHGFFEREISIMNGRFIHRDVFKEIYRFDEVTVDEDGFNCSKGMVFVKIPFTNVDFKFPNYKPVFPSEDMSQEVGEIGLNIDYLDKIRRLTLSPHKALKLKFYGKNKAILLTSISKEKERILLMPIMVDK